MSAAAIAPKPYARETIDRVDAISRDRFYADFVRPGKPVVINKLTDQWPALREWNSEYFKSSDCSLDLPVKKGDVSKGDRRMVRLSDYACMIEEYEAQGSGDKIEQPPYLHDVPFFQLFPHLTRDIEPFPLHLFPKWYWPKWHNYIQFFMGPTGSLTPLHFDTLCTHNLFFQIAGRKKFILIPPDQKDYCYLEGWRWARFDPSAPDFEKYPLSRATTPLEVILGPGEILYIPPGTLHQVHGLSFSISFNIDWHTPRTASRGVITIFKGAPLKNGYYNLLSFMGVGLKIPSKIILPYYKSYLNYIS
jgi:hypothetical protein